jgi:5-hydroxyisourate hydrolase-like protein (transthyretin family)
MKAVAKVGLVLLGLGFVFGAANDASACSCVPERPVCEGLGAATAVFVGRAVGGAEQKMAEDENGNKVKYDIGTIHFAVEEVFSGAIGRKVDIHTGSGGGDCGYWFKHGERYVVYAYYDEKEGYRTSICTRTRAVAEAAEDLSYLRQLPPKGTGARLYGIVAKPGYDEDAAGTERKPEGLPGITVTAKNARGKKLTAVTDAEGNYEFNALQPGDYEVQADLPDYYYRDEYSSVRKLHINDRGCGIAHFVAAVNGRVAGRVVDAEGNPVVYIEVRLVSADVDEVHRAFSERGMDNTDNEGRFEIEQMPPGRYLLGVNLENRPDHEHPYPRTYYPGVAARVEATVIEIGLGQKQSVRELRLPSRLVERTAQGIVVWPDGTPATGAEVYMTHINRPGYSVSGTAKADAQGRFMLAGLDGQTYFVHAHAPKYPSKPYNESGQTHAEPPQVTLAENAFGLKLVLTSDGAVCQHYYKREKP